MPHKRVEDGTDGTSATYARYERVPRLRIATLRRATQSSMGDCKGWLLGSTVVVGDYEGLQTKRG